MNTMNKLFLILMLIPMFSIGQNINCNNKVYEVYEDILNAIGNSFPPPPELNIVETTRKVAYISDNGIFLEKKLIDNLCSSPNFESEIAYVIAHEIAHHYLNHNWMYNSGLGYTSEIGKFLDDNATDSNQRKLSESQADLFAGFFGQIAGYNVLQYGDKALKTIYDSYKIPNEIRGYPSFDERIQILESKKEEAKKLNLFFSLGIVAFELKDYKLANILFNVVLKNNFTSREIYNNIGLSHLMYAITISDNLRDYVYPVSLDKQTRLSFEDSRSSNFSDNPQEIIDDAIHYFEYAIKADENYLPAIQNLTVAKFIKPENEKMRTLILEELLSSKYLSPENKVDLEVIDLLIKNGKKNKINKKAKMGSYLSQLNILPKNEVAKNKIFSFEYLIKHLNIDESNFLFGFDKPYKRFKSNYSKFSLEVKEMDNAILYKIGDNYFIEVGSEILDQLSIQEEEYFRDEDRIYFLVKDFN